MAEEKNKLVHVDFSKYPELLEALDQMVEDDDSDRSKLIRKLVKQEKTRRDALQTSLPLPKQPNRRKTDTRAAQAVAA